MYLLGTSGFPNKTLTIIPPFFLPLSDVSSNLSWRIDPYEEATDFVS